MKIITQNKKAYFDYEVLDTIQAGLVLTGDEVKSLRAGHVNLTGSFAAVHQGELFLLNCNITPYEKAYLKDEEGARRSRKLLLHKREIIKLIGDMSKKGLTIVPLKLFFNAKSLVKVDLGICRHKKSSDKKQALKEQDIRRETDRELKNVRSH